MRIFKLNSPQLLPQTGRLFFETLAQTNYEKIKEIHLCGVQLNDDKLMISVKKFIEL